MVQDDFKVGVFVKDATQDHSQTGRCGFHSEAPPRR